MTRVVAAVVLVLCSAFSGGLAAQDGEPTIIVEGARDTAPSMMRSVRAVSDPVDGSLPRFEAEVCPGVVGLPPALASGALGRMREAIAAAGADLAAEECRANLTLIIAEDGGLLIERLTVVSPHLFNSLGAHDIDRLRADPGPARSWHTTEPKRADGAPVARDQGGGSKTFAVLGASMSRLTSPVRVEVQRAFVVIDAAAIDGLQLGQIADFAVMRGLTTTREPSRDTVRRDSILALFDPDERIDQLSDFDKAYLRSLYSGNGGFTYGQKTRQIANDIDRFERNDP